MRNCGVLGHWGGSGSKGVCGLSGWVRSTTRSEPLLRWTTRSASVLGITTSGMAGLFRFPLFNVPLELEAVFQQGEIGYVALRSDGFHLGHNARQFLDLHCGLESCGELRERPHGRDRRNAR